jgi:hypothetical protein
VRRIKRVWNLFVHRVNNRLLQARREFGGHVEENESVAPFVASFAKNTLRRNVEREVVAVAMHPNAARGQFSFQPRRVIDDHLARQKHHRQIVAEAPRLHGIAYRRAELFAAIELGELRLGV